MKRATCVQAVERVKVGEAAALFHSRPELDAAVDALLLAGFDRADIDIIADLHEVQGAIGPALVAAEGLVDINRVQRRPVMMPEEIAGAVAMVAGVVAALAGCAMAFAIVAWGGGTITAVVTAILTAAVAGGITSALAYHGFGWAKSVETCTAPHRLVLWVYVRSSERERAAQRILSAHRGQAIRANDIGIEKRPDELPLSEPPLSRLRPDPWLGNERLGQQ